MRHVYGAVANLLVVCLKVVAMMTDSVYRFPCNKLSMWSEVCRSRVEAVVVGPDASEGKIGSEVVVSSVSSWRV